VVAKTRRSLAKRAEILRKAALDRHAGRITTTEYLRCVVTFRPK
jgi:hypothetical protein